MLVNIMLGTAGGYSVLTFGTTGAAKLRTWRGSSLSIIREQVFPPGIAIIVVAALVMSELALATLVALGAARTVTGCAIACLFAGFGGYRLLVTARTRSMMCACAGPVTYGPARPQAIAASIVTTVVQVAMGCAWAIGASYAEPYWVKVLCAICWMVPFSVVISGIGIRRLAVDRWFRHERTTSPALAVQADREPAAL